jgi:hypothetical protein
MGGGSHPGSSDEAKQRRTGALLFAVTAVLTAYPSLYTVLSQGEQGISTLIGGDALLYVTIARNSHGAFFTYDGTTPTNGFHPLWQYFLHAVLPAHSPPGAIGPLWITYVCSLVVTTLGMGLVTLSIFRITRSPFLALLTIPGLYYLTIGTLFGNMPAWGFVNGMEQGFSALFGGLFLYLMARALTDPRSDLETNPYAPRGAWTPWLRMGLVLPFIVLSRLDDGFVAVGLAASILLLDRKVRPLRSRIVAAAQLTGPTWILVGSYMIYNRVYAGTALPISGQSKAGIALVNNLFVALTGLFPAMADIKNHFTRHSDQLKILLNSFRWAELLTPMLVSGAYILWHLQRRRVEAREPDAAATAVSARQTLLVGVSAGVIMKALYNLVNVNFWHQAGWYYTFPLIWVSFLGSIALMPVVERLKPLRIPRYLLPLAYTFYIFAATSRQIGEFLIGTAANVSSGEYAYLVDGKRISEKLTEGGRAVKLLAFDDGATGYALPFPTIQGFVFAGDLESLKALKQEHLLRHVYDRGHHILTSATYLPMLVPARTSDEIRTFLKDSFLDERVKAELDSFDYRLLYLHEPTHAPFIEFTPRSPTASN